MLHDYLYAVCLCHLERLVPETVGNLVGEDDDGIDVPDFPADVRFRFVEDPEIDSFPCCVLNIVGLKPLHAANQCDAHDSLGNR